MNFDLIRVEFDDSNFRNSQFLKSEFRRCELVKTTFKNSNLDLIIARDKN